MSKKFKEVTLSYPPKGPIIYKRMVGDIPEGLNRGEIVKIKNKNGEFFGYAFYNPKSAITFRTITRDFAEDFDIKDYIEKSLVKAIDFRKMFNIPSDFTNAYRLVHDWGDGLNGLTIDVFSDLAVVEIYSYGYYLLMDEIRDIVSKSLNGAEVFFTASGYTQTMEGFELKEGVKKKVKIKENNVIFEVVVGEGYKTGFFCDQRENRKYLTNFVEGKEVLDLFSYTGGFGVYAKRYGAKEVTCVDLDEWAVSQVKRNANLNNLRINAVRSDAFTYMRQMIDNSKLYDIVVLDPNKLITSRENKEEGIIKYIDLNKLALKLVKPGGVFVSCSCSGMLSMDEFVGVIKKSASISKKLVKIFKKTGASIDHPFSVNYPEGEYLKVIWSVVY